MEYNNFLYIFASKRNSTHFLKCKFWKSQFCQGTGKLTATGEFSALRSHNHEPVRDSIGELRNILTHRAATEHGTGLRAIYDEEARRFPEAAEGYPFLKAEGTMRASRKRSFPDVPQTLLELGSLLQNELRGRYKCHGAILDVVVDEEKQSHLFIRCQNLMESAVSGICEIHCDSTFKVVPDRPYSRQLFTIHGIIQNTSVVLMYVLMGSHSREAYRTVLNYFQDLVPSLCPAVIITSFESTLQESLAQTWPAAEIKGCLFHYAQAIWKRMRKLGYLQQVRTDPNAQKALKMIMSLPTLPATKMQEGLQYINHFMETNGVQLFQLTSHVSRYWLDTVGSMRLSVYGSPSCTNNTLESFHNTLKTKFRVVHPNFWLFINEISKCIRDDHLQIAPLLGVAETRRPPPRESNAKQVQCLQKAKADLDIELIEIDEYLDRVSHLNDNLEERLRNWCDNVGAEPDSSENDEYDEPDEKKLAITEDVHETQEDDQDHKLILPAENTD